MLQITGNVSIPDVEIEFSAIRAQGAGGQNVNKVSTAVHLRFNIITSSLPGFYKKRLLAASDKRINKDGVIVIKAQSTRSQDTNREQALLRLKELISKYTHVKKTRKATRPTRSSKRKRVDSKVKHGRLKELRKKPD